MPDSCLEHGENTLSCDTRRICGIYERLYGKRCSNRWWMLWNNTRIIGKLAEAAPKAVAERTVEKKTRVSSQTQTVTFGDHVIVCGERLNPTGKKKDEKKRC